MQNEKSDIQARLAAISACLVDQKALDPVAYVLGPENSVADAMLVASATSGRHARGLADGLLRFCREQGENYLRMEGYDAGQWILVDLNDLIVHIFQADARALYRLEDLCEQAAACKKEIAS